MKNNYFPKISVVIPTLNAAKVLEDCLISIDIQDYPKDKVEVIIADGGSKDLTLELAKKYKCKILQNTLKTGEAGKAVGVRAATGVYIALIDSDNILPTQNWFTEMIGPLEAHSNAVGSEPWEYTWRKSDGFITRYSALMGVNDPFVYYLGNYDRLNLLTNTWTEVEHKETHYMNYLIARFDGVLPTIGANGTVFRVDFLKQHMEGDHLFDIDILAKCLQQEGSLDFIKVKNSIIHTFCEASVPKFARKQRRRVKDFLYHQLSVHDRVFDWGGNGNSEVGMLSSSLRNNYGMFTFVFSCITILPLVVESIRGYFKKPDIAWLFHPLACEITLWQYSVGFLASFFNKGEASRDAWKQ